MLRYFDRTDRLLLGCLVLCCSCQAPTSHDSMVRRALREPLDANIIGVRTYYANNPFLSFDEQGDRNPEGFKVTYYAVSGTTQRGAFGDGLIRFRMYIIERSPGGEPLVGRLAKTWEFDPQRAMGWRVKRKSDLGWPYHFRLNWGDADPYGHEIRIVPEFERRDGHVVQGSPKDLKIPPRKEGLILLDDAQL